MSVEHWCNDPDKGKLKQRIFYSATVSTTNPTWTGLGSNAGLRGDRPAQPRNISSAHNGTTVSLHDTNLRRTVLVQEGVTLRHRSAEYPMRHVPSTARLFYSPLSAPAVRHPTRAAVLRDTALS